MQEITTYFLLGNGLKDSQQPSQWKKIEKTKHKNVHGKLQNPKKKKPQASNNNHIDKSLKPIPTLTKDLTHISFTL